MSNEKKYKLPPDPIKQLEEWIEQMIKNEEYKKGAYFHGLLNGIILSHAVFGGTNGKYPEFVINPDYYYNDILLYFESDIKH